MQIDSDTTLSLTLKKSHEDDANNDWTIIQSKKNIPSKIFNSNTEPKNKKS